MVRLVIYIVCTLWLVPPTWAQENLVPNPGFDEWENCPTSDANLAGYVEDWYITTGSPDYFNSCNPNYLGVPYNGTGYQPSLSGQAYMGGYTYSANNFIGIPMEFFGVKLKEQLRAGKKYCVSFYVNPVNTSGYFTDCFGIYLTTALLTGFDANFVDGTHQPQVQNPTNHVITDTSGWTQISGEFAAKGGEQYLSVGCYKTLLGIDTVRNMSSSSGLMGTAYYFFEDVSVVFCDQNTVDDITVPNIITPNADGVNDQLLITAPENYAGQPKLTIYNRWGNAIYQTGEVFTQPWNGTDRNGQTLPTGVYYYVMQDKDGSKSGFIQVSY